MAYEDFTTYTEVDPSSQVTVDSATSVSWSDMDRIQDTYVYIDKGAAYFDTDYIHRFEFQFSDRNDTPSMEAWALSNNLGSHQDHIDGGWDRTYFLIHNNAAYLRYMKDGAVDDGDNTGALDDGVQYYVTITYDASRQEVVSYIRTASHVGPIVDVLAIQPSVDENYQYLYVICSNGTGAAGTSDGSVQNLDLMEDSVSPYEDFTTYTTTDPTNFLVVTPTRIDGTLVNRNETFHVYKDFTAGYFSSDFVHEFETMTRSYLPDHLGFTSRWMMSNSIGDYIDNRAGDTVAISQYYTNAPSVITYLDIYSGGVEIDGDSYVGTTDILYYITVDRDYDGGANSRGQYTVYIRTGSHEGVLVDTIVVDQAAAGVRDFRYLYGFASVDTASNQELSSYVQNLDINEVTATARPDFELFKHQLLRLTKKTGNTRNFKLGV